MKNKLHFVVFSNSIMETDSMAGGYRIFIECLRYWLNQGHTADLITSQQGYVLTRCYLPNSGVNYRVTGPAGPVNNPAFRSLWYSGLLHTLRTLNGVYQSLWNTTYGNKIIFYSTTPFLPDVYPALVAYLRSKNTLWLAAFSMFAPPIFGGWRSGINPQKKIIEPRALALKSNELFVYPSIKRWADIVYVNNDLDLKRIRADGFPSEKTMVVGGGVDVEMSDSVPPEEDIQYEAVFVGRFHPQKGVLELVDIWNRVCKELSQARLIMIGNGPLDDAVAKKIRRLDLDNNIILAGFKDGIEKIRVFRQSRIFVHPALYDSGGMAAAEAMVCGLPGVSFDLPSLRAYYPKGMLKAENEVEFANLIILLLSKSEVYHKLSHDAKIWARTWDWHYVAERLLEKCYESI
jgi:glycosyltransferase involved in cell wall biosynthesis